MKGPTVAPQNTFLDNILRRSNELDMTFLIGNVALPHYPIIYASDGFTRATGYERKDVIHRACTCEFLFGKVTKKDTRKMIQGSIDAKTPMQTEIIIYKKNKDPCWFLLQTSPITNDSGDVILFLVTFKDISHLKEPIEEPTIGKWSRLVEKSLAQHRIDLQKSTNNAKSVFLQLAKKESTRKQKLAQLMSASSMNVQYSWQGSKFPRFIIVHYSLFKTVWDWIILILTLYTAVVAPFVVSFKYNSKGLIYFNLIVDSIFISDVIMNFRTTYVNKGNEIVINPKMICMNYLRSWFAVDFVAAFPYGILNLTNSEGWIEIINVIKVIRLIRLARIARKLDHYLQFGATTLVLWLFIFCLIAHWMACIWYVIAIYYDKPDKSWSWVNMLSVTTNQPYKFKNGTSDAVAGTGPSIASAYMSSLYYCMSSLTTCGFGNIAPNTTAEKLFGCVTMLLGCFLYALIFGQVTAIIQQLQMPSSIYHQKINSIRRFIKLYSVPDDIGARLIDYFMTTWTRNKGIEVDEVLALFPRDLRADVSVQIHKAVFENLPEFRCAPTPALRSIAGYFWTLRTAPGDRVVQQGEILDSLYFVEHGSLEIRKKGQIVGILGPGDVVGCSIRPEKERTERSMFDIYALTYSDLHNISIQQLQDGLSLYPEFYRRFKQKLGYSFDLSKEIRVLSRRGTEHVILGNEEETTFVERISTSGSSTNSQDQTMVEGDHPGNSLNQLISLQEEAPRLQASLESNDEALEAEEREKIMNELNKLKRDFAKNILEVNSKLENLNETMSFIKNMLKKTERPEEKATVKATKTEETKESATVKPTKTEREEKSATVKPTKTERTDEKARVKATKTEQRATGYQEQKDDDNYVRQYKPSSTRTLSKSKVAPKLDDLDEIEKALEEIELPDMNDNKAKQSRNNAAQRTNGTKRTSVR